LSFLPEDRGAELRALFFESAAEVLQVINDAGLQLEKRPADEELIRGVRRAVHTLKGDSAACGFNKLSEIAHELEDILSPQVAQDHGPKLAEVVLSAVDAFEGMLSAYQKQLEPPSAAPLRTLIHGLLESRDKVRAAGEQNAVTVPAGFQWSEYERLMISEAVLRGESVYNVALRIDNDSLAVGGEKVGGVGQAPEVELLEMHKFSLTLVMPGSCSLRRTRSDRESGGPYSRAATPYRIQCLARKRKTEGTRFPTGTTASIGALRSDRQRRIVRYQ